MPKQPWSTVWLLLYIRRPLMTCPPSLLLLAAWRGAQQSTDMGDDEQSAPLIQALTSKWKHPFHPRTVSSPWVLVPAISFPEMKMDLLLSHDFRNSFHSSAFVRLTPDIPEACQFLSVILKNKQNLQMCLRASFWPARMLSLITWPDSTKALAPVHFLLGLWQPDLVSWIP